MTHLDDNGDGNGTESDARINIDYIKANHFRTVSPSGLLSSVTPQGNIQIALFSERQAIPQRVIYKLEADGGIGERVESIGRDAIVREVEIIVTLDLETAMGLATALADQIKELSGEDL